jgi:TonB family protein
MMAVYPSKAGGLRGQGVITCIVKTDGLLRDCKITKESPPGLGFGPATLLLAPTFLMKPALLDGRPVEAAVTIPVNFEGGGGASPSGPSITVVTTPAWDKTPTIPEILAELDKKVGDRFADGKVVFQCTVSRKTGHLSDCITINTSVGMSGFTPAARALTSKFEVDKDFLAKTKNEVRVNLAFSFPDMQSEAWSKRYLLHPVWLRTVSPDPNQPLFPEEAAKTGLKTGKATVDCVLAPNGSLTQCEVVSESTPGVGFGELAKKIAEVFVANPWTEDGLPADGAHVRMPIQMNYEPPANAPDRRAAGSLSPQALGTAPGASP